MSKILIFGGTGLLGANWALKRQHVDVVHVIGNKNHFAIPGVHSQNFDYKQKNFIRKKVDEVKPDLIINCAGLADVDRCQKQPEQSYITNVTLAKQISKISQLYQIPLIHISTDHLFEGTKKFVTEQDIANPQNTYAEHKLEAEKLVLKNYTNALILRTTFYGWGPSYRQSFSDFILNNLEVGAKVHMYDDVYFTPLYIGDLVKIAHELIDKSVTGIVNVCAGERISKYKFSLKLAEAFGFDSFVIQPIQASRNRSATKRPFDLSLSDSFLKSLIQIKSISIDDGINALKNDISTMKKMKLLGKKIPYGKHFIDESDVNEVVKTLKSGFLTQGPKIDELEEKIAQYTGANYAVAVSSATAGLHLSYLALGVGPSKSVLTSPITFLSTANAAYYCGGFVRFADINPNTVIMSLDKTKLELKQHDDIHVVVPVLFGGSGDGIPEVARLAKSMGKYVVEDAAHGLGGTYECGEKIGSCKYSDCTVFSLHPVKSIAAGEGGVITTNNEDIYRSLLRLRSHGVNKKDDKFQVLQNSVTNGKPNLWYYEMQTLGFHYRLTDIQASLACSQFNKLDGFINRRRQLAKLYFRWCNDKKFIRPGLKVDVERSANHLFVALIDFHSLKTNRNEFMRSLKELNIFTQVHYIPITEQPFYRKLGFNSEDFPNSQAYYKTAISLPIYFSLTDEDFNFVISKIDQILNV
tara:strand:+ start:571 stop:2655 length:2085 start_codon:yes stop_codon:yes gene_type:complete